MEQFEASNEYAIGIDLGTTFSCIGVWQKGKPVIIPNQHKTFTMPSMVSFGEQNKAVGHEAYNLAGDNPKNTVFNAKRLIGQKYSEKAIKTDLSMLPFNVLDVNDRALIAVTYQDEEMRFIPE